MELRILRRLFTPEDSELTVHLTLIPEEPRLMAHRAKIPVKETARRLEEMSKKGLLKSKHRSSSTLWNFTLGGVLNNPSNSKKNTFP